MKTIICSHGFGVRADSYGMFPEIAKAFADYDFKMFDYYEVKPNGDTVVRPLEEQAEILQRHIDDAPEGEIVLLGHSQGSTVAGLVDLDRVNKVILLAPPIDISRRDMINRLRTREGSKLNPYGMSIVPRRDGTTTYIPASYMDSIERGDRMALYQKIADTVPTVIIRATKDQMLGLTKVNEVKHAQHTDIDADHNFTGDARIKLISALSMIL